jgi:hypothetical protein
MLLSLFGSCVYSIAMPGAPPLPLIGATQERELLARSLELYGDAVVTRMLPALKFSSDELLEMCNIEGSLFELGIPPRLTPIFLLGLSLTAPRSTLAGMPGWSWRLCVITPQLRICCDIPPV